MFIFFLLKKGYNWNECQWIEGDARKKCGFGQWYRIYNVTFISINDGMKAWRLTDTSNDLFNNILQLAGSEPTAGGNAHVYTRLVPQMIDWN